MLDREQINKAREVLALGESVTIVEIKEAYRKSSLKYHPDKCKEGQEKKCEEKFKELNNANEVLIEYCLNYKFPLKNIDTKDFRENKRREEHIKRFYDGWWGNIRK